MAKTLIAFFSRADENYFGGAMRYVKTGNTEIVVNDMKEMIDADTFKIEMKDPYSPVYMTCIDEAKKDLRAKARPELVSMPASIRFFRQDDPSALHKRRQRHGWQRTRYQKDLPGSSSKERSGCYRK